MLSRRHFHARVLTALGAALIPALPRAEPSANQASASSPKPSHPKPSHPESSRPESSRPESSRPEPSRRALREGREWRAVSPPQPPDETGGVEVLEFFSYGCSHCARINPLIKDWSAGLPADVHFRRVPVTFGRAAWENLARLYYALELAGVLQTLDQQVFQAVIEERVPLYREGPMLDWVAERGVEREAFAKIFQGFAVETKVGRAKALSERYEVDGVPTIAVGGRYAVLNRGAKGYEDILAIAEQLIDKARKA